MAKSRQEINRQNYLRSQAKRQAAARERMRAIRDGWRQAIAEWDRAHEWDSPPADWQASGLSEHAMRCAFGSPLEAMIDAEEADEWAA